MIGFQPELQQDVPQVDKGLDTKNLEKKELYDMLSTVWHLPSYSSKGVTRDYLLRVHRDQVFRVNFNELKRFEVELAKDMLKKIGTINNALLVRKLNILLVAQERRELGFTEYEIPESTWFHKIARYIDQTNLLEIFERLARPEASLTRESILCNRIYYGRVNASNYLFRTPQVRQCKKLCDNFKTISDTFRTLLSFRINIEVLMRELEDTRTKIMLYESNLSEQLTESAFAYTALENPNIRTELLIGGAEAFT